MKEEHIGRGAHTVFVVVVVSRFNLQERMMKKGTL